MIQNNFNQKTKRFGKYSISDNKVRVNYQDGSESVLFEDISSISYKTINTPNFLISLGCTFLGFIILIIGCSSGNPKTIITTAIISVVIIVIGIILMYVIRKKFDNVIIETRGGKEIVFSVEYGTGSTQMEKIENTKREYVKKI